MPNKIRHNPLLLTDSYKETHWRQYPKGTKHVYSYLESRGGMFKKTEQVGLQYILREHFSGQFFDRYDLEDAKTYIDQHIGPGMFNYDGWRYILEKHAGHLPLKIRAIPEGHVISTGNALVTVENTDPEVPWLTNWVETVLLQLWYPITVGTLSREIKQIIGRSLAKTGTPELLPFKLHDFGYRGVSSVESAGIGGFAHLVNFQGTDTLRALEIAYKHYFATSMPGFSIPASEHSTITSWGESREADAYRNMLEQYPTGLVACVSDSYDMENAVRNIWGDQLRDEVMKRQGTLVIRPDSDKNPAEALPKYLGIAWERFGGETNSKGYRVLPPQVRFIQGDGVNYHAINQIVNSLEQSGWSMDNLAFGMGGALLQSVNRDTQKFAFKASAIDIDGKWQDVYKRPFTDKGKASKPGRFKVIRDGQEWRTLAVPQTPFSVSLDYEPGNELVTVFENGELKNKTDLMTVRKIAASYDTF